ncbi:flagellar assembly peptidoglycan hydrolase FlgJ [Marinobacterium sp. MBR-109]|jgi:flagellar protein FlgJ|uniref:flagellar assembly peptidoglycan hydrolase FlgJ n=1 Tax=Marinobacterium sp. MBR-109 TaxID=3156462 RepID=UPI003398FFF9
MAIDSGRMSPSQAALYTDLNQLQKLKNQAGNDQQAALKGVAQEFEQLFMNMMLKSMRQASDVLASDSPFNSGDVKFYQEMFDQQMTLDLSKKDSIGLADIIVKQLSQQHAPVVAPGQDDKKGDQQSMTEQMLSRAFGGGPLPQTPGMNYRAASTSEPEQEGSDTAQAVSQELADQDKAGSETAVVKETLPNRFETPAEFIEQLMPLAEQAGKELGVNPNVLLAQAALETGWGKFITRDAISGESSRNLFNIKAHSSWEGDTAKVQTLEYRGGVPEKEQARFRAYDSYADSFTDYVDFLRSNPRYQQALEQGADPTRFVRELHNAGYATDPEYANKIERIFTGDLLAGLGRSTQEG